MKTIRAAWILVLFLSACNWIPNGTVQPQSLLTPYVTMTATGGAVEVEPTVEIPTPEPTPSPTPFVHTLASGETISSLALTYGLEADEIIAINPQITPKALSIGTEVLIPYIGTGDSEEDSTLAVISEPLALEISEPDCTQTAEGGLWCVVMAGNALEQDAAGITVKFSLKNDAGEIQKEQTVPALLNLLEIGEALPVTAYFSPEVPAAPIVEAELVTALPLNSSALGYQRVEMKVNSIDMNGRTASVSALIPALDTDSIWVVLIAYDLKGNVVGVRRLEYPGGVEGEQGKAIKVYVYSIGEDIRKVDVIAEAKIQEQ